jgi:hypothetical protein
MTAAEGYIEAPDGISIMILAAVTRMSACRVTATLLLTPEMRTDTVVRVLQLYSVVSAAMVAMINSSRLRAKKSVLGFLNPLLYSDKARAVFRHVADRVS